MVGGCKWRPVSFYHTRHGSLSVRDPESCVINTSNSDFITKIMVNYTGNCLLDKAPTRPRIVARAVPALVAGSS